MSIGRYPGICLCGLAGAEGMRFRRTHSARVVLMCGATWWGLRQGEGRGGQFL
jgi:hypothetical protein